MRRAAIDLGTNTARLLIGDTDETGRFHQIALHRRIVRLGGGFSHDTGLSDDAQQRSMDCLCSFAEIIADYGVKNVNASATSAVRDAANGRLFVDRVFRETGIRLAVIDGDMEGRLTLKGVISALDVTHDGMVVVDIGGGSTEITIADQRKITGVFSLPLGVVRLTEGFVSPEAIAERIISVLQGQGSDFSSAIAGIKSGSVMIATAGTATTLAAIKMEMLEYDYRRVNNFQISRAGIAEIYERLLPIQPHERLLIPGMEPGREDLIIAGILILLHTMDFTGFDRIKVSDYGLLEGLVLSDDLL